MTAQLFPRVGRGRQWSALTLAALLALAPNSSRTLQAQTLSILTGTATAEHPELGDPSVFGIGVSFDIASRVLIRTAYTKFASTSDRTGKICTWYEPMNTCDIEAIHGDSDLAGISVSALPYLQIIEGFFLGVGGGLSLNRIHSSIEGESGRVAWALIPKTGQVGGLALASLRLGPLDRIPLSLSVNAVSHWVSLEGCVTKLPTYDPFCGTQRFQSFEVELGYELPFLSW